MDGIVTWSRWECYQIYVDIFACGRLPSLPMREDDVQKLLMKSVMITVRRPRDHAQIYHLERSGMAEKLIVQACYLCETIIFGRSSVTVRNGWYVHARCDRDFPERGRHTKMAPFPTTFPKYVLDQDSPLPAENRVVEPSNFTHRPYASVKRVTMGRTVFYRHPGSADGTFAPRSSPAMVQEVLDEETGKCRLFIFGPKGQHLDEIEYGDGPCQWSWPPII